MRAFRIVKWEQETIRAYNLTISVKSIVFPSCAKQGRVAALAEGTLVPVPIVRAVSCYETRRVGERASVCV